MGVVASNNADLAKCVENWNGKDRELESDCVGVERLQKVFDLICASLFCCFSSFELRVAPNGTF